jgi:hypothetical protein
VRFLHLHNGAASPPAEPTGLYWNYYGRLVDFKRFLMAAVALTLIWALLKVVCKCTRFQLFIGSQIVEVQSPNDQLPSSHRRCCRDNFDFILPFSVNQIYHFEDTMIPLAAHSTVSSSYRTHQDGCYPP